MKGRHGGADALDNFMRDYWAATREHPFERRSRVWVIGQPPDERYVVTEMRPFDGQIHISSILSPTRERGHASAVLKQICALADRHGVVLDGAPVPFDRQGGRTQEELEAWYRRHGFENDDRYENDDEPVMRRLPGQK